MVLDPCANNEEIIEFACKGEQSIPGIYGK